MKRFILAGGVAAAVLAGATVADAMTLGNWLSGRPAATSPAVNVQASSAELQIQQLEESVRQLTGRVEDLNYQVLQLQEQLRKTQEDNEFRFQQLEKKPSGKKASALEPPAGANATQEAASAAASDTSSAAPTTVEQAAAIGEDSVGGGAAPADQAAPVDGNTIQNQTAPAAGEPLNPALSQEMAHIQPGTLGSLIFNGDGQMVETTRNPVDNSSDTLPGVKSGMPAATAPAKAPAGAQTATAAKPVEQASITPKADAAAAVPTPEESYQKAYQSILGGNYAEAEQGFKSYLDNFPGSARASDASFWMGEAQYSQGHYSDAAKTFLNAYKNYEKSQKAPEILLKLGMSLAALDNKDTACATYREIPKRYPKASKVVISKVASEQARLSCPKG